jgi:hypothetical protein
LSEQYSSSNEVVDSNTGVCASLCIGFH